jgi:hypothetical protein
VTEEEAMAALSMHWLELNPTSKTMYANISHKVSAYNIPQSELSFDGIQNLKKAFNFGKPLTE